MLWNALYSLRLKAERAKGDLSNLFLFKIKGSSCCFVELVSFHTAAWPPMDNSNDGIKQTTTTVDETSDETLINRKIEARSPPPNQRLRSSTTSRHHHYHHHARCSMTRCSITISESMLLMLPR
mmetsp:Transcript_6705/g.16745  ORF Transcript_6705/g.16745 Transcript_6705/m.16745 type:complete len:124 (+) Transcript_6705:274-645(+)